MNERAFRVAVTAAILVALAVGGSFWTSEEQEPAAAPLRQTTNQSSPWWRASGQADTSRAGSAYGGVLDAGAARLSAVDAGYGGTSELGAPQPWRAEPLGPSDLALLAALMYCGRHPAGPGPEPGTFRNRLPNELGCGPS